MSHTINDANKVIPEKYKNKTPNPEKKQKLFKAGREVAQPQKKAIEFVKEVMVIEGPECYIPILILSLTGRVASV